MPSNRALLLFFAATSLALAQSTRGADLGRGRLLVASRALPDPNFAKTVVLLVHYDEDSVLGLILNRRTKVPLSRVFEDLGDVKGSSDPIYSGGPVEKTVALALLRSRGKPPAGAEPIFADVHLISGETLLQKTLAAGADPGVLRVYAGYSGWTMGQLQMEVKLGAWSIFRGEAGMVFDPDPDSLWPRLIRKTEERIAGNFNSPLAGFTFNFPSR
jgi:putative transcriptional regulator